MTTTMNTEADLSDKEQTFIEDRDGNKITEALFKGTYYPPFPGVVSRLTTLPCMEAREDDIVICAYPKSGTHWTWEIITMLSMGKAETIPGEKTEQFFEKVDQAVLANQPSPRVLNTHLRPDLYPADLIRKKCKIVTIQRNPKDVSVSYYHHIRDRVLYGYKEGKWPAYLQLFMNGRSEFGSWFDYVLDWKKFTDKFSEIPVLQLYYEDMLRDLPDAVEKIAGFLELPADKSLCKAVAQACTFDHMKQNKKQLYPEDLLEKWWEKEYNLYRKGTAGDWKNWFTVAQNEQFDALIDMKMKDSGITVKWHVAMRGACRNILVGNLRQTTCRNVGNLRLST